MDECQPTTSTEKVSLNSTDLTINNKNENTECIKTELSQSESKVMRRWVPKPKPMVKNPSMLRRAKPVIVPVKEKIEPVVNQNTENENPVINIPENLEKAKPPPIEIKTTESQEIKQCPPMLNEFPIKSPSDPDRILTCPLSPNKIPNRTRIKPTPKLIRRNSVQGSASESEDDGKRSYSRIRNDSVCSITSYTTETTMVKENTIKTKEKLITIKVQKLFRRSEQSRKVAEARRVFYQKFGSDIPDKKRLTMMDLIYYNPATNPMPQKKSTATIEEVIDEPDTVNDEQEDDPDNAEDEDNNPVPQVKVGPNGEIILDEQSLVIEQTGTKKGREKLANSQIINVDDLDRAYGVYKRPKRSKDWSSIETLRFYRSLNTVGTDFSLMVPLFPGRTRRELKMKFKKEEKINRALIDKALTNPLDFNLSDLEKQLKEEEELIKNMVIDKKKPRPRKPRQKIYKSVLASQMDEENEDDPQEKKICKRPQRTIKQKRDMYSALSLDGLTSSESESEEEMPKKKVRTLLPTIPSLQDKIKNVLNEKQIDEKSEKDSNESQLENYKDKEILEECEEEVIEEKENEEVLEEREVEVIEEEENESNENVDQNCAIPNILPNHMSTVEPGSLMVLSSVGPDGKHVYKVFMVTPGQTKIPINLSEEVVQSLTNSLGEEQAVTLDLPVIHDNNTQSEIV